MTQEEFTALQNTFGLDIALALVAIRFGYSEEARELATEFINQAE